MSEALKMIAEYLSEKDNITVEVSGKEIKSDVNNLHITLPEDIPDEMFDVTLASLIHESGHMKYTRMKEIPANGSGAEIVLNALEDIRVDNKNLKKYPNAVNLYSSMLDYIDNKIKDKKDGFSKELQIMRELIIRSYNNPEFDKFKSTNPEVIKFFDDNKDELNKFTEDVKSARSTKDLVPMCEWLIKKLFGQVTEQQKQELENLFKEQQKAQEEYSRAAHEEYDAGKALQGMEQSGGLDAKHFAAYKANASAQGGAAKQYRLIAEEIKKQINEERKKGKNTQNLQNLAAENEKYAEAFEKDAKTSEEKAKKLESKIPKNFDEELKKLKEAYEKARKENHKAYLKAKELDGKVHKKQNEIDDTIQQALKDLKSTSFGFESIDKKDLQNVDPKFTLTLEQELLEFLKNKFERKRLCDNGAIDPLKLPTYYSGDDIYKDMPIDRLGKTKIYFLVDKSGSMQGERAQLSAGAVKSLCEVIEKGINEEGMDIEYGVWAFDDCPRLIKDFETKLSPDDIATGLRRTSGGTSPGAVIENINGLSMNEDYKTKQIVFMISDGDFGYEDYDILERVRKENNKKWVMLGIQVSNGDKRTDQVFGQYDCKNASDIKKMLFRAIQENL